MGEAQPGAWRRLTATRRGRILLRVAFYGAVVFLALPYAFSEVMLKPPRQPPSRVQAGYDETWVVSDGLRLRAWVRRGTPAKAAVVVAHGLGDSLESYTEVAETLGRRGHTVLLLDLRAHGGSGGKYTTLGGREREDVRAAVAHLTAAGLAPSGFLLMGTSMGSVAVLRAAADRNDLRGVVAEAPYDNYRESMIHHAWLYYSLPRWVPLIPLSIAAAEWRAGFDADEVDAIAAARSIKAPLLVIVDGADQRMPEPVVRRVFDAHPGPKTFWVAPGAEHAGAILSPGYWKTVIGFLDANGL